MQTVCVRNKNKMFSAELVLQHKFRFSKKISQL